MSFPNSVITTSNPNAQYWSCIACDQTGTYVAAGTTDGYVYTTQDSWLTYTKNQVSTSSISIGEIVMSNSGTDANGNSTAPATLACVDVLGGKTYLSSNFGTVWGSITTKDEYIIGICNKYNI